jgi:hypothetical protein
VVPRPRASDEQQTPLALQILRVGERIGLGWRDRSWRRDNPVCDADDRDRLELQPFHAMHRADTGRVFRRLGREGGDRDARGLQRGGGLLCHVPGADGNADRVRLDALAYPHAHSLDKRGQFRLA